MSDRLYITSNAANILRAFDALPKNLQTGVSKGLRRALLLLEDIVKRRADVKFAGARSGLVSRLTSYVETGGALAIDGVIGFRKTAHFPYELSQEYGAQAKPGKSMVIPVSPEAKALAARGLGPKDMAGVKLFIPKGKHVLVAEVQRARLGRSSTGRYTSERVTTASVEVQYILIKSLRPRLHFRENVMDNLDVVSREVEGGMKEAFA
jgi:hypothetical protein